MSVTRDATSSSSSSPVADDIKLSLVDYGPKYSKTGHYSSTDASLSNNLAMPMSQSATSASFRSSSGARFESFYFSTNFNTPIYWSSPSY